MIRYLIVGLGLGMAPTLAVAATATEIRACNADPQAENCATVLNRVFVCAQAPAIEGCEAVLAARDEALAVVEDDPDEPEVEGEIEPDVTPRAEGELADDPSADAASGVAEGDENDEGGDDNGNEAITTEPGTVDEPATGEAATEGAATDDAATGDAAAEEATTDEPLTTEPGTEEAPAEAGTEADAAADAEAPVEPEAEPGAIAEDAMADGTCAVLESANWEAVVGPVEGVDGPQLVVTGQITLPTPGWATELTAGIADRSAMPVQRVELTVAPPSSELMVAQVLTEYDVRLETPSISAAAEGTAPYSGVMVMCGDTVLAEIDEIGQPD